jgi:hypothetical protein
MAAPGVSPPGTPTDATPVPQYGAATLIYFPMFDNDGDPRDDATIDTGLSSGSNKVLISKDGNTFVNSTNSVGSVGYGWYYVLLTASEMTADAVLVVARTTTTDIKNTPLAIYPAQDGDYRVDVRKWMGETPFTLISGRVDANTQAMANGVITAAVVATNALDADALAADAVTEIQSGLATSANQTTILNRLGSFTGTGINTILGFLRAIARKDVSLTPSDMAGTYDNTTDSLEAKQDNGAPASSLGTQAKAEVNAEAVDALSVDTYAEPGAVPGATSSLKDKIGWLFVLGRNKRTQTSTSETVRNDGDSATIGSSTKSDDGTTFTRGKYS